MQGYKKRISFIHAADLHLASPFSGLSEKDRAMASHLNQSLYCSFDAILTACLEKKVDFLLIAGDVFDSGEKNLQAIHHFIRGLTALYKEGIQVIITTGNHDPLLTGPGSNTIWDDIIRISGGEPPFTLIQSESHEIVDIKHDGETVARICGVSFTKPEISDNPVRNFPKRVDNTFPWIGVVHCTIGSHSDHIPYAPLTLTDLTGLGYDYWALGHIHAGFIVKESNPTIIYPGNIQGRNWRETGPKGCIHAIIEKDGSVFTQFYVTASVRFEKREISINGMEHDEQLISATGEIISDVTKKQGENSTILAVDITGSGKIHSSLYLTSLLNDILQTYQEYMPSPPFCYLSAVYDLTKPSIDRIALKGRGDIFDEIVTCADELTCEPNLAKARQILSPLYSHHSLRHIIGDISDLDLALLIRKAEELLLLNLGISDED